MQNTRHPYAPKGTCKAEMIEGITAMTNNCGDLFKIQHSSVCSCDQCKGTGLVSGSTGHLILSSFNKQKSNGVLGQAIELEIYSRSVVRTKQVNKHSATRP